MNYIHPATNGLATRGYKIELEAIFNTVVFDCRSNNYQIKKLGTTQENIKGYCQTISEFETLEACLDVLSGLEQSQLDLENLEIEKAEDKTATKGLKKSLKVNFELKGWSKGQIAKYGQLLYDCYSDRVNFNISDNTVLKSWFENRGVKTDWVDRGGFSISVKEALSLGLPYLKGKTYKVFADCRKVIV